MSRNRLRENPVHWTVLGISLILVLSLIGMYVAVHNVNNASAQQLEARLQEIPLPPDTKLVDSGWAAQRLAAAGNGMQYAGALLIRSELGLADLEAFYDVHGSDGYVIATNDERLGRVSLIFDADHDLAQPDLFMIVSSDEPKGGSIRQLDLRGH